MVGFFLPGDTLLITVGVIAASVDAPFGIVEAIVVITAAAILGDNVGYTIGRLSGKKLFRKKDGILFRQEYIERSESFYEKHGAKTMTVARFVPIVRSFAPIVAGIGKMPRGRFIFFDTIGALLWAISVTLLGYFVGSKIPNIGRYLEVIVIGVMVLAIAPTIWHIAKEPTSRKLIAQKFKKLFRFRRKKSTPRTEDKI